MLKKLIKPLSILLSTAFIVTGIFFVTNYVNANSIVVDSTTDVVADDGVCTLREAIEKANDTATGDPHGFVSPGECGVGDSGGLDTITFSPAAFPGTITLVSSLPSIVTPIVIDGVSGIPGLSCGDLPGGVQHVLGVEIDATTVGNGLVISTADATGSRIRGLVVKTTNQGVGYGVSFIGTTNANLECSYIGIDQLGTTQQGFNDGVYITNSSSITIGGINPGDGNVLSGNRVDGGGIHGYQAFVSNSNTVNFYGNIVGLDATGNAGPFVDQQSGIAIADSNTITIGGNTQNHRNIISGMTYSFGEGVLVQTNSNNIVIQGNYIGTDVDGDTDFASDQDGIEICGPSSCAGGGLSSSNILIGGSNPGEGNLIAGATSSFGEDIGATDVSDLTIKGNIIGFAKDGVTPLGGTMIGINIDGTNSNVIIGGPGSDERNIVGNHGFIEMSISNVTNFDIKNNYVGVDKNGTNQSASGNWGITMIGTGILGGPNPTDRNIIAKMNVFGAATTGSSQIHVVNNEIRNNSTGLLIFDTPAIPGLPTASIRENSFHDNALLGIDVATDTTGLLFPVFPSIFGVNLNDILDSDTGPNNNLNYPVIHSITESPAGTLNLNYYLDVPAGSYRIEFFKNPTAGLDSSYHGEGEQFVFADTFTSTGTIGSKSVSFPGSLTDVITATATECTDGTCTAFVRTSEFGPTVPITAGGGSGAGLDFGDVTTNQTTAITNGGYHIINTNYLGSCIDADTGTVQNTTATADDTGIPTDPSAVVGVCATANDDEDGVTFDKATYTIGDSAVLTVTASAPGIVNVWVDKDSNGSFLDAGEQVLVNAAVAAGSNTLAGFTVPATNGTYPLRVRYVSDITKIYQESPGVASPRGEALDGEVEDYNLQVGSPVVPPPVGGGGGGAPLIDVCSNIEGLQLSIPAGYTQTASSVCTKSTQQVQEPQTQITTIQGQTLTCPYFTKYLKLGNKDNDPTEVTKWQKFLNEHMGEKLTLGTIYNQETYQAIKRFQKKYESDVLIPWNLRGPTGWTYKTTRMKANKIMGCPESKVFLEFPKVWWELR